jgi:hypothetical protein
MKSGIKVWFGVELVSGKEVMRRNLKGLCGEIGLSYNTAKKGQGRDGVKKRWLVGEEVWDVWLAEVK